MSRSRAACAHASRRLFSLSRRSSLDLTAMSVRYSTKRFTQSLGPFSSTTKHLGFSNPGTFEQADMLSRRCSFWNVMVSVLSGMFSDGNMASISNVALYGWNFNSFSTRKPVSVSISSKMLEPGSNNPPGKVNSVTSSTLHLCLRQL